MPAIYYQWCHQQNAPVKVWGLSTPAPLPLCMEGQALAASSLATSFPGPKVPYKPRPWPALLLQGCFALSRWDVQGSTKSELLGKACSGWPLHPQHRGFGLHIPGPLPAHH